MKNTKQLGTGVFMGILMVVSCQPQPETRSNPEANSPRLNVIRESVETPEPDIQKVEKLSRQQAEDVTSVQENDLKRKSVLQGKASILLPAEFSRMGREMLDLKYPNTSKRPNEVYTNSSGGINIAFNHTADRVSVPELPKVMEAIAGQFARVPSIRLLDRRMQTINGKEFFTIAFVSQAVDTRIYNLIFGTELDGRLLLGTFNCTEKDRAEWEATGKKIVHSVEIL